MGTNTRPRFWAIAREAAVSRRAVVVRCIFGSGEEESEERTRYLRLENKVSAVEIGWM